MYDNESSDDGRLLQAQTPNLALPQYTARYMNHKAAPHIQDTGTIPPGFSPIVIARHHCYTNGKPTERTVWFRDGNKLQVPSLEGHAERAGVALSCGPLIVTARVKGLQTLYRGELQGAVR